MFDWCAKWKGELVQGNHLRSLHTSQSPSLSSLANWSCDHVGGTTDLLFESTALSLMNRQ